MNSSEVEVFFCVFFWMILMKTSKVLSDVFLVYEKNISWPTTGVVRELKSWILHAMAWRYQVRNLCSYIGGVELNYISETTIWVFP